MKILIIDDEKLIRWSFKKKLEKQGHQAFAAATGEEGIELFKKHVPTVVFVDNKLPGGMAGLEVISKIKTLEKTTLIVLITAYSSINTAVDAMKAGAAEYIQKPFSFEKVNIILNSIKEKVTEKKAPGTQLRDKKENITFDKLVGESKVMKNIVRIARKIACTQTTTILLLGESGTGKDLFAKSIHNESTHKDKPFVIINCSAFPETLLESELFGYERGAFTDAKQMKKGLFEIAEGGTVFLDEIGEINLSTQIKLLGVLENRIIRRLGGTKDIPIEIRVIAATNKDLKKSIKEGNFREDLYYRLKVFQITLPALREHKEDIRFLTDHFRKQFNAMFDKNIAEIEPTAQKLLMQYDWPGNIRELRNAMERAVVLETGNVLQAENFPDEITEKIYVTKDTEQLNFQLPEQGISLNQLEKEVIRQAMIKTEYNQTKAAKLLDISRDTLRYKIKKHNLK